MMFDVLLYSVSDEYVIIEETIQDESYPSLSESWYMVQREDYTADAIQVDNPALVWRRIFSMMAS